MARIKRGIMAHKRHKKLMDQAKGYRGSRSRHYKVAHETVMRALSFSYRDRRVRKRDFRRLWIIRINAAARMHDMTYGQLIDGLNKAGIELNRKALAEMAVREPQAFAAVAEQAKAARSAALAA